MKIRTQKKNKFITNERKKSRKKGKIYFLNQKMRKMKKKRKSRNKKKSKKRKFGKLTNQ